MKTDLSNSRGVYASLANDYMFKKIFGCEESKDILLTFLNHIIGHGDYKSMKPYIDITEDAKRDAIKKMKEMWDAE